MPAAEELAARHAATYINSEIDAVTSRIIKEAGVSYTDFYEITEKNGEVTSVVINSLLVNDICQKTAAALSASLNNTEVKKIPLPIGLVTGVKFLSNMGPKINIRLIPSGSSTADYETALIDSGINRVNYKIYLNIKTSVTLVSPLSSSPLEISRKFMLTDTVFTGSVPNTYLNIDSGSTQQN